MFYEVEMSVSVSYFINDIEYIARETFILKTQKENLVTQVQFNPVIIGDNDDIVLDGSSSFDPEDLNNANPINCVW